MPTVDYYYSAHSAFAYLGATELYAICARHDVTLIHKPIDLSPVVEAQGSLPFRRRTQAHVDYFFGREIERWAELRGVPVLSFRPTHHDADYSLASGMIAGLGLSGGAVDALSHAILKAHWCDDADLSDAGILADLATSLGHNAQELANRAISDDIRAQIAANTAEAKTRSVFGSPTYILEGETFYGQDRLELLERALLRPFAPSGWTNPPVDEA